MSSNQFAQFGEMIKPMLPLVQKNITSGHINLLNISQNNGTVNITNNDLGKSISKSSQLSPIIPPNVNTIQLLYNSTGNDAHFNLNVKLSFSSPNQVVFLLLDGSTGDLSSFKLLSKSQSMHMIIKKNEILLGVVSSPLSGGDSVNVTLSPVQHPIKDTPTSSSSSKNNALILIVVGAILWAVVLYFIFRKHF